MAVVSFCDRHFYFGKRQDAREFDVPVEIGGVKVNLDLCKTCFAAITSWQELLQAATTDDGIQEPTTYNRTPASLKFLHSQSPA